MAAVIKDSLVTMIYYCTGMFMLFSDTSYFPLFCDIFVTPCVNILAWVTGSLISPFPPTPLQAVDKSQSKKERRDEQ